jgi:hypothetical protein
MVSAALSASAVDDGEGVADLVREAAGHVAQGFDPLFAERPLLLQLLLEPLLGRNGPVEEAHAARTGERPHLEPLAIGSVVNLVVNLLALVHAGTKMSFSGGCRDCRIAIPKVGADLQIG